MSILIYTKYDRLPRFYEDKGALIDCAQCFYPDSGGGSYLWEKYPDLAMAEIVEMEENALMKILVSDLETNGS